MSDLKCKYCGGEIVLNNNEHTGKCQSCGAVVPFSALEIEERKPVSETGYDNSNLIMRVFTFLEGGEFKNATDYCEKILDSDATCSEAYLGKLMAGLKVKNRQELGGLKKPFDNNINFRKAVQFGDENLKQTLLGYAEKVWLEAKKRKKKTLKRVKVSSIITAVLLILAIGGHFLTTKVIIPKREYNLAMEKYNLAVEYMEKGEYEKALATFNQLNGFEDSEEKSRKLTI